MTLLMILLGALFVQDVGPAQKAAPDDLITLLGDRETQNPEGKPGIRTDLAQAVDRLGGRKVETLLKIFKTSRDSEVRRGASFVLGEIGDTYAVPVLLADYRRGWHSVVQEQDLGKFDDPEIARLYVEMLQSEDATDRERASIGVIHLRARSAVPILAPLVTHETTLIRARAVEGLGAIGDRLAVPALITALGDTNEGVVMFAAQALGRIGDPRALDPLKAQLAKSRGKPFLSRYLQEASTECAKGAKANGDVKPSS